MYNNFKAWLDHMIARMNVEYEKNGWHNEESHKDSFSSLHQDSVGLLDSSIRSGKAKISLYAYFMAKSPW